MRRWRSAAALGCLAFTSAKPSCSTLLETPPVIHTMSTASVTTIYRYPVKSMMGETLSDADIGGAGILGDRGWAVRDERRGGIRGGKKIPQLMTLAAQSGPAAPLITAPDGDSASASYEGINE